MGMRSPSKHSIMTLLFFMLTLSLSACACAPQQNRISYEKDPYSRYGEVLESSLLYLPSLEITRNESNIFDALNNGTATEAFDTQASPALREGIASYWYPQYTATVVIAADRDRTDAKINGWSDLAASGEKIGMTDNRPHADYFLAAISYGLEGEDFSLHSAIRLLSQLHSQKNLMINNYDHPVLICFDYQAAAMIKDGRNLEIIIPTEGTLSFEKGLLSNAPLDLPDCSGTLIAVGFRLTDGTCDDSIYPPDSSYAYAKILGNYDHLNAKTRNTTVVMRRDVQNTHRYTSADGHEHQVFALLYIVVLLIWVGSITHRAMQKGVRRSALICGALLICWVLLRMFRYQLDSTSVLKRYAWYGYYIFQLGIPLVILWMSLVIDKPKETLAPPKWWFLTAGLSLLLVSLVLTNDLHRLVFRMDVHSPDWDANYTYGLVFYVVVAVAFMQVLLSQIIMIRKSWRSPRKYAYLFPVGMYFLFILYTVAYSLRNPVVASMDITLVTVAFVMMYMEACVQIGMVPVNRNYRQFFACSPQNMQILDDAGQKVLGSVSAMPIETPVWQGFCNNTDKPQPAGESELLFADRISGGMVIWREDISSINRLHHEIETAMELLRRTNKILEQENAIQGRLAASKARIVLFTALEGEIRQRCEKLSEMLHNIPEGEDQTAYIARVALLVCYIKRRCHLFFLEQNNRDIAACDLNVYMDELAEFANVTGVKYLCNCLLHENISLRHATLMYDLTYALLDWTYEHEYEHEHGGVPLFMQIAAENGTIVMRVMSSGDMVDFNPDPVFLGDVKAAGGEFSRKPLDDAEGIWLIFLRKQLKDLQQAFPRKQLKEDLQHTFPWGGAVLD